MIQYVALIVYKILTKDTFLIKKEGMLENPIQFSLTKGMFSKGKASEGAQ